MRRLAALTMTALVSMTTIAAVTSPAGASSAANSKACPSTKQSKSSSMSGMDMDHGHSSSTKKSAMSNCPTVAGVPVIDIAAKAFEFSPSTITLTAGEPVTIKLSSSDLEHDFTVQKYGHVVHAMPNKTAKGGLVIKQAGTYKFWCTIKGHKANGMVGTLTVLPAGSTTTTPITTAPMS